MTRLLGGEDVWGDIERVIREQTVKYLYVLSRQSNHKEGSLRELKVADAVKIKDTLGDFIIPLRIDDLPHSEANIELARLNAIDCSQGWSDGLKQLVALLEKEAVLREAVRSRSRAAMVGARSQRSRRCY